MIERSWRTSFNERRLRTARLGAGMVLLVFLAMHLANHALGLVSLDAAEAARWWFLLIWRNPAGSLLLYGSVLVHAGLALRALYRRRTLVMPWREAAQIGLGLAVPLLIADHVTGTRVYTGMSGIEDTYRLVGWALWVSTPWVGAKQALALVLIWAHGCLGLHFWLRFRPWYPRWAAWLLVGAVLLPVLALLGFAEIGKLTAEIGPAPWPDTVDREQALLAYERKDAMTLAIYAVFGAAFAGVFAARAIRNRRERRNLVEIRYDGGQSVRVPKGHSVLEASRVGGIPHYAVCGGRGRCSTCRIRIIEGRTALPPPVTVESATLARIDAAPDVRLACQLKPLSDIKVMPLLTPERAHAHPAGSKLAAPGREREIAILFCDIRGFTALADRRLPFDVVFLLNRYFAVVGRAVEQAGGQLDKFIGDGAMALFGLTTPRDVACRQALDAARAILGELAVLNEELAGELRSPLRVAIGIHAGPAIVGSMGYGGVVGITAIGDTVNVASRLESAAKEFDAALVVSDAAARLSGIDMSAFELRQIAIRGSAGPLDVRVVPQGGTIGVAAEPPSDMEPRAKVSATPAAPPP